MYQATYIVQLIVYAGANADLEAAFMCRLYMYTDTLLHWFILWIQTKLHVTPFMSLHVGIHKGPFY